MSKFSDYINEEKNNNSKINKNQEEKNDYLKSKIEEYSNYSQDKLINDFVKLTIEKKKRGELTDNELNSLKNTISPMLNNVQKDNLEKLLQMVRDVE